MNISVTLPRSQIDAWCQQANEAMDGFVESWLWPHMVQAFANQAYFVTPPNRLSWRITNKDARIIDLRRQAARGLLRKPQDIRALRNGAKFKVEKTGVGYHRTYFEKYFYHGRTEIGQQARIWTRGIAKLSWFKGLYGAGVGAQVQVRPVPQALTHITRNGENWRHAHCAWNFSSGGGLWRATVDYPITYVRLGSGASFERTVQGAVDASLRNSIDRFNEVRSATYWTGRSRRSR